MLRTVRHAHVVQFYGMGATDEGMPFIVTELMELGSLTGILHDKQQWSDEVLGWPQRISLAVDIASGMALVHSLGRMHRDLKSGNLLVSDSWVVKVVRTDDLPCLSLLTLFGFSIHCKSSKRRLTLARRPF